MSSVPAEPPWWLWAPPLEAAGFVADRDFNRSISAACDLIVSFNSRRTDDDSALPFADCFPGAMMVLVLTNDNAGLLIAATDD